MLTELGEEVSRLPVTAISVLAAEIKLDKRTTVSRSDLRKANFAESN
jgi:hypothetical protein